MIRNSCFQNQWCCLFLGIQQLVLGAFTRGDRRTSLKYCWMRYHAVINQKAIALSSNSLKCHDNHYTVISDKVNLTRLSRAFQWLFPQVDSLLVVKSLSCCLHIQAFLSISQFIKHLYDVEIIFFFFFQTDRRWFVFPALIKSCIPQAVNLWYDTALLFLIVCSY